MAAAMLAGCGSNSGGDVAPPATGIGNAKTSQKTFTYTGAEQKFKVPSGVTAIAIDLYGAAAAADEGGKKPALGGRTQATIPATPGETLYVFVGGAGFGGGFNGGGSGGGGASGGCSGNRNASYYGGGASDVREGGDSLNERVVVAGGAGGPGAFALRGGLGGGTIGGTGHGGPPGGQRGRGGSGGTQSQGGAGGAGGNYYGNAGSAGTLGAGGAGGVGGLYINCGGGGGGGYYGGGGGGSGSEGYASIGGGSGGGGGGGSSYVESSATRVQMWQGWQDAINNGMVVIRW